jgi:hypothetical protein
MPVSVAPQYFLLGYQATQVVSLPSRDRPGGQRGCTAPRPRAGQPTTDHLTAVDPRGCTAQLVTVCDTGNDGRLSGI